MLLKKQFLGELEENEEKEFNESSSSREVIVLWIINLKYYELLPCFHTRINFNL